MQSLRSQRQTLEELWKQGLSGQKLLASHTELVDAFVSRHFEKTGTEDVRKDVAIVALGGYGRQELFPYSDIDIMILFRPEIQDSIEDVVQGILYPLWDTGLEIGHGVRTVAESIEFAGEDFFFQVALLDGRLICGSQPLFEELMAEYQLRFVEGRREEFVATMKRFRSERRNRFGSHSYLLEPQIKEGKGGFRDIQAMMWTAKVIFGFDDLDGIAESGILDQDEQQRFTASWNMLSRIRNRLHYISSRKNDQLYFEQQEEMADAFEYKDEDGFLAVEHFMRDLYGHLRTVAVVTDLFFDHVDDVFGLAAKSEAKNTDKVLENGICLRNNRIHLVASEEDLVKRPWLLMRLFLASARTGVAVHHRTRKQVSTSLGLVSEKTRVSQRMANAFFEIIQQQGGVGALESMLETGLLTSYIPEFEAVLTLAQHDLYHINTVDRHLLQTVAELQQAMHENQQVAALIDTPRVLFAAALLHDIGKGSGNDHSLFGSQLVVVAGERLGMSEKECDCLAFLVKYHLFLPENAMRRDLNDDAFISRCAEIMENTEQLAMLYLLTIADSKATGPSAWSEWKASLLLEMYLKVLSHLETGHSDRQTKGNVDAQVREGTAWLRDQVVSLVTEEDNIRVDVDQLPADYLMSFTPQAVAEHLLIHRDNYNLLRQQAIVVPRDMKGHWSLLIMSRDQPGLLAKICGVLTLHNLSVLNAQIFTWAEGSVVDVIDVRPVDGLTFSEKEWDGLDKDLGLAITHRLGLGHRLYKKLARSKSRAQRFVGRQSSEIVIDNKSSDQYSVIEVHSADRPGQLYRITQTLADFGVNIFRAFIATEVQQLIDVFYVLDSNGEKIKDPDHQQEIIDGIDYEVEVQE